MNPFVYRSMSIGMAVVVMTATGLAQTTPPAIEPATAPSPLQLELANAQRHLESHRRQFLESHPDIVTEKLFIESLLRQLANPQPVPAYAIRRPTTNPELLMARLRLDQFEAQLPRMELRYGTESRVVRAMKAQIEAMHWRVGAREMEVMGPTTRP